MTSWRSFATSAAIVATLSASGCGFGGDDGGCMANSEMGVSCATSTTVKPSPTTTTAPKTTTTVTPAPTTASGPTTYRYDDGTTVIVTTGTDGKPTTEVKLPPAKPSSAVATTTKPSPTTIATTTTTRVTTTTAVKPSIDMANPVDTRWLDQRASATCTGTSVSASTTYTSDDKLAKVMVSADGRYVTFGGTGLVFADIVVVPIKSGKSYHAGFSSSQLNDRGGQTVRYELPYWAASIILCEGVPTAN